MNRRTLTRLIALVAGLVLVLVVLEIGEQPDDKVANRQFIGDFADNANGLRVVELRLPDGNERVTLRRDGARWVVGSSHDYPADLSRLGEFVTAVADARIVESRTSDPDKYAQLELNDPEAGGSGSYVSLRGDEFNYELILGKKDQGNFRNVRRLGDPGAFLVDQELDIPDSTEDWLQKDIIDLAANDVKSVTISHADGENIVIRKESPEAASYDVVDIPEGRELSYATVADSIAGALASLELLEVRPAIDAETATSSVFDTWDGLRVTVTVTEDGESAWLSFEAEADEAQKAEALNGKLRGWQYRIADYKKNQLTRRWDDILKTEDESE